MIAITAMPAVQTQPQISTLLVFSDSNGISRPIFPDLTFTSCVTLGGLFTLSCLYFAYL